MDESEDAVEAHNRRELWRDAENHLRVAGESLVQAQSALDDLGALGISESLGPIAGSVEYFRSLAAEASQQTSHA